MCLVTLFMYICRGIINFIYKINLLMFLFEINEKYVNKMLHGSGEMKMCLCLSSLFKCCYFLRGGGFLVYNLYFLKYIYFFFFAVEVMTTFRKMCVALKRAVIF